MRKLKEPPLALGGLGLSFFFIRKHFGRLFNTFALCIRWYSFCFIFTITNGICKIF